jgi:hypothetical protein
MNRIRRERRPLPDVSEFERIGGLALLFRRTEKLYGEMGYQGYRAQVVTYSIARLSNALARRLPFADIWKSQEIPEDIRTCLAKLIVGVRDVITQPPRNRNVTEWCKREDCWDAIVALPIAIESADGSGSTTPVRQTDQPITADGTVIAVAAVPSEVWFAASKWAKDTGTLLPWQRGIAYSLGGLQGRGKQPSPKQAIQGRKLMMEAIRLGFGHEQLTDDLVNSLAEAEPSES